MKIENEQQIDPNIKDLNTMMYAKDGITVDEAIAGFLKVIRIKQTKSKTGKELRL